ncbi:zinc finger and BTB domain-containing protein 8A.1-A-like [Ischnura elegans]|uniref:zinc finger and BTB domain-containing protein 8A.1-A-like n=1 Tax=Ischnura elegans TaxID=197161 RepID=UPI001ED89E7E|nr:zinc finger and BTB domain-containing protein 8A.1-A-like [Ischnura elegans]
MIAPWKHELASSALPAAMPGMMERQPSRHLSDVRPIRLAAESAAAALIPFPGQEESLRGQFRCPICRNLYRHKTSLQRHLRYQCGVEPKFRCHLCDRRFNYNFSLKNHMASHRAEGGGGGSGSGGDDHPSYP